MKASTRAGAAPHWYLKLTLSCLTSHSHFLPESIWSYHSLTYYLHDKQSCRVYNGPRCTTMPESWIQRFILSSKGSPCGGTRVARTPRESHLARTVQTNVIVTFHDSSQETQRVLRLAITIEIVQYSAWTPCVIPTPPRAGTIMWTSWKLKELPTSLKRQASRSLHAPASSQWSYIKRSAQEYGFISSLFSVISTSKYM